MENSEKQIDRRSFMKQSSMAGIGFGSLLVLPHQVSMVDKTSVDDLNIVGPKEGFTPQIGTLVSMLNWMRAIVLNPVKGMSVDDLDYLIDDKANSIGAMLWHLAATERFYQIHTFEGKDWGDWSKKDEQEWSVASGLGDQGRKKIKGNSLDFYLKKLKDVRAETLRQLATKDDDWLLSVDEKWFWGPTNNYCKWFHVCEHESNHNGQFKFIKSRLPSAKK